MLKKLLTPFFFVSTLALSTSVSAQFIQTPQMDTNSPLAIETNFNDQPMIWTAFSLGGRSMTSSYDARKYIETLHLADQDMVDMFKEAQNDYDKYIEIKARWVANRTKEGIKQMAYVKMIQEYATRSPFKNEWKAFKITQNDYFKRVQEMETKTLKSLLDEGKGIVYAREKFGAQLKELGYPHQSAQTDEELYWEWYELQKSRIVEKLRLDEVKKFEYLMALGYQKEFYVRPVEIFDFSKEVNSIIEEKINQKRISSGEVAQLIQEDPRIQVLAKGINFYGPETAKISELKEIAPQVYSEFMQRIDENVITYINEDFATDMLKYENIALQMATKYQTTQKLEELSKEMALKFMQSNDYSFLMMSKIYELSIAGIENSIYDDSNKKSSTQSLGHSYLEALAQYSVAFLSDEEKMLSTNDYGIRFIDNFYNYINQSFHNGKINGIDHEVIKESAYLDKIRNLSHWVLKFQVKKASTSITPLAQMEVYDSYQWLGQSRIEKFLKNKQYDDNLEEFKLTKFKPYWSRMININPTGRHYLSGDEAINFVLGIEETTNNNEGFSLFQ